LRKNARTASVTGARIGIAAGLVLLAGRIVVAGDPIEPFRFAASLFSRRFEDPQQPLGSLIIVGLAVHLTLSVFYGLLYFWLHRLWNGDVLVPLRRRAISGTLFGLGVWLLDFHLFARLSKPWIVDGSELVEAALHGFAYGLPLALLVGLAERRAGLFAR
jgi:hypothetical protein